MLHGILRQNNESQRNETVLRKSVEMTIDDFIAKNGIIDDFLKNDNRAIFSVLR